MPWWKGLNPFSGTRPSDLYEISYSISPVDPDLLFLFGISREITRMAIGDRVRLTHPENFSAMSDRRNKILLAVEFSVLFFGIPLVLFLIKRISLPSVFLVPVLVGVFFLLRRKTDFTWKELVYFRIGRRQLIRDGIILLCCAACLVILVLVMVPAQFLNLPRNNPWIWLALGAFYPVFSAYPQEILYRTFIFRRYVRLFPVNRFIIMASGVSFSFVHILYYHPISMILTLIGGIYLASSYARTRSVLYTALLHAALGMFVFTVGLGEYFWLEMNDYL